MALSLAEARKKHGIHETQALQLALELIADKNARRRLGKLVPPSDYGGWNTDAFPSFSLFVEALPAKRHGAPHFEEVGLTLDASKGPGDIGVFMGRVTHSIPPIEEARKLDALVGRTEDWNAEIDERLKRIREDSELPEKTRKRVAGELLEHSNRINTLVQKIGEAKLRFVKRAARIVENAGKTPEQKREEKRWKRKDSEFNRLLLKLGAEPLRGREDPRAAGYAKKLYKLDSSRLLRVREELAAIVQDTGFREGAEDEADDAPGEGELENRTLAWNIGHIFENEEFRKFIEGERKKVVGRFGIEPFPEGERVWQEGNEAFGREVAELAKKHEGDELARRIAEAKARYDGDITKRLEKMLAGENKRFMRVDRKLFKLPHESHEQLHGAAPVVLFYQSKPREARAMRYHL
jgi:hypothetical protein